MKTRWMMGALAIALTAATFAASAQTLPVQIRYRRNTMLQTTPRANRRVRNVTARSDDSIPWAQAAGKPTIHVGHSIGFYVWHEGEEVSVATTDESDKGQHFAGRIVVEGGTISDLRGFRLEHDDRLRQVSPTEVDFRFDTYEALDGLKFKWHGGKHILFDLTLQGQHTNHIFYGKNATEAPRDPLIFKRGAGQHGAILPWSQAEGRPSIDAGHSVGFYVWHEGNRVYVVSTSESDHGLIFQGRIDVRDGAITDPAGLHLEHDDRFRQPDANTLLFSFHTAEATDGIQFTLNNGKHIRFMLQLQGRPTEHIFYGKNTTEAEHDPVVFDLSK